MCEAGLSKCAVVVWLAHITSVRKQNMLWRQLSPTAMNYHDKDWDKASSTDHHFELHASLFTLVRKADCGDAPEESKRSSVCTFWEGERRNAG